MEFYTYCARFKNKILVRGYDKKGKRVNKEVHYKPTHFLESDKGEKNWFTVFNKPVSPIEFDSMYEASQFVRQYKEVQGVNVYGFPNYVYPFLNENFPEINFDPARVRIGYIDIETDSTGSFPNTREGLHEVQLITLRFRDAIYVLGFGPTNIFKTSNENVKYIAFDNEADMLKGFIDLWSSVDLDIITGWNLNLFDIPYLVVRINRILGEEEVKRLSPYNRIDVREEFIMGKEYPLINLNGITILDYMDVYKKFGYRILESYSLNYVSYAELGERKLNYSEYSSLAELYEKDPQKFTDYNIKDTNLVYRLEEKLGLLQLVMIMAYTAKMNYIDCFSSVRSWDVLIHNFLYNKGKVVPSYLSDTQKLRQIAGGYVKEPILGLHEWVVSYDATSLYPHVAIQYNISPEKYLGKYKKIFTTDELLNGALEDKELRTHLKENNCCISGASVLFKQDSPGFIPQLMESLFAKRKEYKKKMIECDRKIHDANLSDDEKQKASYDKSKFNSLQMAFKILLNSGYGSLSNQYFRWYQDDLAESITLSGQLSIRWAEKTVNDMLNNYLKKDEKKDFVAAIDTDSVYVNFSELVKGLETQKAVNTLENISKNVITPLFNKNFKTLMNLTNCKRQLIDMKREIIGDRAVWTGKKHYIINYWDKEGVRNSEPELKIMGIESIKSSTPEVCRDKINEAIKIMMRGTENQLQSFVKNFRNEFNSLTFDAIAFPRGCNNIKEYTEGNTYKKGTPAHVKAAIMFNNMLNKHPEVRAQPIQSGQKIKWAYLKMPNPIQDTCIGAPDYLPPEFELEQFIDKDIMFEKAFLQPVKSIADYLGWRVEKKPTLNKFFKGT